MALTAQLKRGGWFNSSRPAKHIYFSESPSIPSLSFPTGQNVLKQTNKQKNHHSAKDLD